MAIELISCPACGTKNALHRTVCLRCGVNIWTPAGNKTTEMLSFSGRRDHWIVLTLEKRKVNSKTSEVYKYVVAAGSILSAGPGLFDAIKKHLGNQEIKPGRLVLFNAEVTCYILHMLDRTLAMPAFAASRDRIMICLVLYLRDAFSFVLEEMGYAQFGEQELAKRDEWPNFYGPSG